MTIDYHFLIENFVRISAWLPSSKTTRSDFYLGTTWSVPWRRMVPMIWRRMWWAVRPVRRARNGTRIRPIAPGPPTVRSWVGSAAPVVVVVVVVSAVVEVACCNRNRKDRSSRSGFSGNEGNSERCWSRRRTCKKKMKIRLSSRKCVFWR